MKEWRITILIVLALMGLAAAIAMAQIVEPVSVVDFVGKAPRFELYNNSTKTLTIQLQNHGAITNGTGSYPYFYIAMSATNRNPIAGSCAWQTIASNIFTVTYTSNDLAGVSGEWIYGCGISNAAGITTFNQGPIGINPDPWR